MERYSLEQWAAWRPRRASQSRGSRQKAPFVYQPYQCRSPRPSNSSVSKHSASDSPASNSSPSNSSTSDSSTSDSSASGSSPSSTPPSTPSTPSTPIEPREETEEQKRKRLEREAEKTTPCCFALLDYKACGHSTYIKLVCGDPTCYTVCGSSSNGSVSPLSGSSSSKEAENRVTKMGMLVVARVEYIWRCATCLQAERREEMTLREEEHSIWLGMIEEKEGLTTHRERRASVRLAAARARAGFERRDATRRTAEMLRDNEAVRQWVKDYGVAVCRARFGGSAERREGGMAAERSAMLRKSWDVFVRSNIMSTNEMLRERQHGGMPSFIEKLFNTHSPAQVNRYPVPKKGDE